RAHGLKKTHGQFCTKTKLFGLHGAGPDHDFVEHRRDEPAVDSAFKPDMMRAWLELGANKLSIRLKAHAQSQGIGFAANEARARVRELLHGVIRRGTSCRNKSALEPVAMEVEAERGRVLLAGLPAGLVGEGADILPRGWRTLGRSSTPTAFGR